MSSNARAFNDTDVLCTRLAIANKHPGNKQFLKIVAEHKLEYHSVQGKKNKTQISRRIVEMVQASGGRFLKKEEKEGMDEGEEEKGNNMEEKGGEDQDKDEEGKDGEGEQDTDNEKKASWVPISDGKASLKTCLALRANITVAQVKLPVKGKLGIFLSGATTATILKVSDLSVLKDQLSSGDLIIAFNGENVSTLSAKEVYSKLSQATTLKERVLTVLREKDPKADNPAASKPPTSSTVAWDTMFLRLKAYKAKVGHCQVPRGYNKDPRLARWVDKQRRKMVGKNLSVNRNVLLQSMGFLAVATRYKEPDDRKWENMLEQLLRYKSLRGDYQVPAVYKENLKLGNWVHCQRRWRKAGKLAAHRLGRLDEIGFEWSPFDVMFNRLCEYKEKCGNTLVPRDYPGDPNLGKAIYQWQRDKGRGRFKNTEKMERLNAIGFIWIPTKRYLSKKNVEGRVHATIAPIAGSLEAALNQSGLGGVLNASNHAWGDDDDDAVMMFDDQTSSITATRLPPRPRNTTAAASTFDSDAALPATPAAKRQATLNSEWEHIFARLERFKAQNGHCLVPRTFCEDRPLARWVDSQRKRRKLNNIPEDRIGRLDSIGFAWDASGLADQVKWDAMYGNLVAYQEDNGHSQISTSSKEYPELGAWVAKQRSRNVQRKLTEDRVARLNAIGFVWRVKSNPLFSYLGSLSAEALSGGHL